MTKFETLMQQLTDMAAKGEIGNEDIKNVEYTLMSARRKSQSDARKNEPGYDEKKASSIAKASATRDQSKKDAEASSTKFDADYKVNTQAIIKRKTTNKLPLSISAYGMGVKGTKNALGDLAKYYSERLQPGGPGGQDSYNLELKPKFQDQSFDDAQTAWDVYDGEKSSSLNEQFIRMKQLAGIITEGQARKMLRVLNEEEDSSIYYKLGYQTGPNGSRATVDTQSVEYKTIEEKANQLTSLLNDKDLIDFAKGSTDSIGSSRSRYEGLQDVAGTLLFFNEIKDRLGKTID